MKFLLRTAAFVAVTAGMMSSAHAARAYIGTYTPNLAEPNAYASGTGEGIYLVNVDDATGALSGLKLVAKDRSPAWLVLSADSKFLYAINEIDIHGPGKSGSVTAYAVDARSGALKKLNSVDSGGAMPCYISIHASGKFALVANYAGGSFSVIPIKADGSLGEPTDVVKPVGPASSASAVDAPPGQGRAQTGRNTRGHMIASDPSGQYVVGDDAGRDRIFVWRLNTGTGKLTQVSVTNALAGSAPRHFGFSPDGKTLYQIGEYNVRLTTYDFADGKLTPKGQSLSALPDGYQGSGSASRLIVSADGKHVYSANRTHNSIATFAVGSGGLATKIATTPTEGDHPRSLTIDPTGKFFYSLNLRANSIATFRLDPKGVPKFTGKFLAVGAPAAMVFLP
ncbi:MAG: 6-phosphogluconolactonase [Pseudomonadota bacterium]|jgi:6-phosphogluconolactonase (cycloisomerase 2 family)